MAKPGRRQNFEWRIPEGDNRRRQVCTDCDFIHYVNPRIIVGTVASWEGKVLLCRRAIEPREGFWTLPAGFMEQQETAAAGAARETLEESGARVETGAMLAFYDLPDLSQVQIFYLASMESDALDPGEESHEAQLFDYEDIPWDSLAFPTIAWALRHWRELGEPEGAFAPYLTPAEFLSGG